MNNIASGSALRRRDEILKLVRSGPVRSQEELQEMLRRRGFAVTQPTLSRDLKDLGLAKTATGYVAPSESPAVLPSSAQDVAPFGGAPAPAEVREMKEQKLRRVLRTFVLSVDRAGQIVVVRTPPADAHPVARAIDEACLQGVVGTIAGDDTIFLAARDAGAASRLARRLTASIAPASPRRRARR